MNIRIVRFTLFLAILGAAILLGGTATARAQFPFDECSGTEAWMPLPDLLPDYDSTRLAAVWNGELYMIANRNDSAYSLVKWNGTAWTYITDISVGPFESNPEVRGLNGFRDKLYMSGVFNTINGAGGFDGPAEWDGTSWKPVPGSVVKNRTDNTPKEFRTRAFAATTYSGELIVSGIVNDFGTPRSGIAAWDGTKWRIIAADSSGPIAGDGIPAGWGETGEHGGDHEQCGGDREEGAM